MNQAGGSVVPSHSFRGDADVVCRSSPARSTSTTSLSSPPSPSSSYMSSSSRSVSPLSSPARTPPSSPARVDDNGNGQRRSGSRGRALLILGVLLAFTVFSLVHLASSVQVLSYWDGERNDADSSGMETGPPDRRSIDSTAAVSIMPLNRTASSSSDASGGGDDGATASARNEDGTDGSYARPGPVTPHPRISTLRGAPSKTFTSSFFKRARKTGLPEPKTRRKVHRMYDPKLVNAGVRKPLNGLFNNGEEQEMDGQKCVPMREWQSSLRPSCNTLHEIDMANDDDDGGPGGTGGDVVGVGGFKRLGEGGWRDAWQLTSPRSDDRYSNVTTTETVILKTLWGRTERPYDALSYEMHRADAAVSERLTGSPRVVDVYGHCGQSVLNEAADLTLEDLMESQEGANMDMEGVVRVARDIALAVADVHTVDGGVGDNATVVHRDIKMDNIVLVNGRIKVNDFNSAVLLTWDENGGRRDDGGEGGGRCKIRRNWQVPWFKSHGEFPFTEKVDVLCLGGLLHYVLTGGHQPYEGYDVESSARKFERGEMPKLPKSLYEKLGRSNVDAKVVLHYVQIMDDCFGREAGNRPNAGDVARELDILLKNITTPNKEELGGRGSDVVSIPGAGSNSTLFA